MSQSPSSSDTAVEGDKTGRRATRFAIRVNRSFPRVGVGVLAVVLVLSILADSVIFMAHTPEAVAQTDPTSEAGGDVNCDNVLSIADAVLIAQFIVGTRSSADSCQSRDETNIVAAAGDVNGDGALSIADAVLIAQCVVGLTHPFCAQPAPVRDLTHECREGGGVHTAIGARGEYDQPRIPLETQVWFFPTEADAGGLDTGRSFGHAHLLTCVPHIAIEDSEITDRVIPMDFQILAHLQGAVRLDDTRLEATENVEVRIDEFEIRGKNGSGSDILVDRHRLDAPLTCTSAQGQCVFTQQMDVALFNSPRTDSDKPGFVSNGPKELRFAAIHEIYDLTEPQDEHVASVRAIMRAPFHLDLDTHGAPVNPSFNPRITESSGWLVEADRGGTGGYATIGISEFNGQRGLLPVAPISRSETPELELTLHVEADPCRLNCIVDRMPITRYWAFLNPGFHGSTVCAADAPKTCREAIRSAPLEIPPPHPSPQATDVVPETQHQVTVDISDLEPGVHRLVLAVEQPMVNGRNGESRLSDEFEFDVTIDDERFESTLTGLLVVRFIVTE